MHLDSLAALIMVCDRVVSIDNSTAHFAGALLKKVTYSCLTALIGVGALQRTNQVIGILLQSFIGNLN